MGTVPTISVALVRCKARKLAPLGWKMMRAFRNCPDYFLLASEYRQSGVVVVRPWSSSSDRPEFQIIVRKFATPRECRSGVPDEMNARHRTETSSLQEWKGKPLESRDGPGSSR
nr:hypothetical protein CFP56_67382 [Quercus suber]